MEARVEVDFFVLNFVYNPIAEEDGGSQDERSNP